VPLKTSAKQPGTGDGPFPTTKQPGRNEGETAVPLKTSAKQPGTDNGPCHEYITICYNGAGANWERSSNWISNQCEPSTSVWREENFMRILEIPYPDDLPEALGKSPEAFEHQLKLLVAARMYELGHISSGRAAELAGVSRVEFLEMVGQYRISIFNYSLEELEREIREAQIRAETVR
jgi:predicted HTH domain antitoxin